METLKSIVLISSLKIEKTYIYANSQILAQHDGDHNADRYFYLHDRLGSVREIIDTSGNVVKYYTYEPFGQLLESGGALVNPFMFSGQFFDDEVDQYHLRARQYYPYIARFTSRDPVFGKPKNPITLHRYLYCSNNPLNFIDPDGRWAASIGLSGSANFTWGGFKSAGKHATTSLGTASSSWTLTGGLLDYYCIFMPYHSALVDFAVDYTGLGGTAGGAFVVAHDTSKESGGWSLGFMGFWAGGISGALPGRSKSASAMIDFGYSKEAKHITDLRGPFREVGGSVTSPPVLWGLGYTAGLTWSQGLDESGNPTGINLWTFSPVGLGTPGWGGELHGFTGKTYVSEPFYEN